jgi:hypothetical protein
MATTGDAREAEPLLGGGDTGAPASWWHRGRGRFTALVAGATLVLLGVCAGSAGTAMPAVLSRLGDSSDAASAPTYPTAETPPLLDPLVSFNTPRCRQTRASLARVTNHDGDVVVIPELRAVYVDIVKAASESIRSALEDNFHASWSADLGQYKHPVSGRPQRSSTSYLTDDVLANYTFFTFVRDPNTRFRSSYEQAICRERCTLCTARGAGTMFTPTISEITAFLQGRLMHFYGDIALRGERSDEITLQEAWVDEHFESQILRLSGATKDGSPVPLNFVGRVESFEHDWARLMDHLGVKEGDPRRVTPGHQEHSCDIPERGKVVQRQRESPVTTLEKVAVAALYHDDFECLGYHKPKI